MELATPITIYWDLPADSPDDGLLQRICSDISDCRPLMLQMYHDAGSLQPGDALSLVLEQFRGSRIAVTLTVPAVAFESAPQCCPEGMQLKELLVSGNRLEGLAEAIHNANSYSGIMPGVSFSVTRENWRQLPELVQLCRNEGIGRLVLPMQRLYNIETPFMITAAEQHQLAAALSDAGGVGDLNLTIHDPFLWRAFNPGIPFPQAGCQAANTMIAIAPDGGVYPCPTLPVRLGNIGQRSLKEIICSAEKKEFRRRLLTAPAGCRDCSEVSVCRGGCRGRGLVLEGSLDGIDPVCR
ncbi:MAG: GeoRSP system SPASM domain protein [Geobacteraceae bacterium GWC2_55_20]|nr:MAG: GeoRSP system SPASM domain protein [Geobacteraceae bacterium GWC2_55_20]OGU26517.1 MAG: GeoRSP system SPASM domain protein [Geobacteraceae bacterium GWF2_54_21]HBA73122.1 GeoRSP system SPASM domain protein [Geobacter sp.]HCE67796.1 GeoRSP system SPASM domain protein [Geobacter sp.]